MTAKYKTIRYQVPFRCHACGGSGFQRTKHGTVKCTAPDCINGEVMRWINEVRHVEDKDDERRTG